MTQAVCRQVHFKEELCVLEFSAEGAAATCATKRQLAKLEPRSPPTKPRSPLLERHSCHDLPAYPSHQYLSPPPTQQEPLLMDSCRQKLDEQHHHNQQQQQNQQSTSTSTSTSTPTTPSPPSSPSSSTLVSSLETILRRLGGDDAGFENLAHHLATCVLTPEHAEMAILYSGRPAGKRTYAHVFHHLMTYVGSHRCRLQSHDQFDVVSFRGAPLLVVANVRPPMQAFHTPGCRVHHVLYDSDRSSSCGLARDVMRCPPQQVQRFLTPFLSRSASMMGSSWPSSPASPVSPLSPSLPSSSSPSPLPLPIATTTTSTVTSHASSSSSLPAVKEAIASRA